MKVFCLATNSFESQSHYNNTITTKKRSPIFYFIKNTNMYHIGCCLMYKNRRCTSSIGIGKIQNMNFWSLLGLTRGHNRGGRRLLHYPRSTLTDDPSLCRNSRRSSMSSMYMVRLGSMVQMYTSWASGKRRLLRLTSICRRGRLLHSIEVKNFFST